MYTHTEDLVAATRRLTECLEENMMLQGEQDVVAEQVSESSERREGREGGGGEGCAFFYNYYFFLCAWGRLGLGLGTELTTHPSPHTNFRNQWR